MMPDRHERLVPSFLSKTATERRPMERLPPISFAALGRKTGNQSRIIGNFGTNDGRIAPEATLGLRRAVWWTEPGFLLRRGLPLVPGGLDSGHRSFAIAHASQLNRITRSAGERPSRG
jgi:hypothetical protein